MGGRLKVLTEKTTAQSAVKKKSGGRTGVIAGGKSKGQHNRKGHQREKTNFLADNYGRKGRNKKEGRTVLIPLWLKRGAATGRKKKK